NWEQRLQVASKTHANSSLLCFTRAQENPSARAEREYFTIRAIRLARETAATPVPDEPVTPQRPIALRHTFHQIALDFFCIPVFRSFKALRQTNNVRANHDSFVFPKRIPKYEIRRFSPNAGLSIS